MSEETVTQEKKSSQARCFARRHMRPADFAYYSYALSVSSQSDIFYSDDRRDAEEFGKDGVSKNTISESRARLEQDGWLRRIDKGKRQKRNAVTGRMLPIRYEPVTHHEWAALHPDRCRFLQRADEGKQADNQPAPDSGTGPDPTSGTGEMTPAPDSRSDRPQFPDSPAPEIGAKKEVKKERKERADKETPHAAQTAADVLPVWIPLREWQEFLRCRRRKPNDYQLRLLIEQLEKLRDDGHDPVAVLNQTIIGGYPSFYPLPNGKGFGPAGRTRRTLGLVGRTTEEHIAHNEKLRRLLNERIRRD